MNTSFEILEPKTQQSQARKKRNEQTFSASTGRRISFAAASLSVAMSIVAVDSNAFNDKYVPIFSGIESVQKDLVAALGHDYEVQARLLQRLETIKASLRENWNGENDCPIEDKAYNNTKTAIKGTPSILLRHWRLFPNPNGTLLFSPKDKTIAGISIGNVEFSYAVYVSDDKQLSGKEPFSEQAFKSAIKQIHRILGYV